MRAILSALLLTSSALAAQGPSPQPITLDGRSYPRGSITVGGKRYVAVEALTGVGVTSLGASALGLYNFQLGGKPAVKLGGCAGEWLFNGHTRVRFQAPIWLGEQQLWQVPVDIQTAGYGGGGNWMYELFPAETVSARWKDGRVFDPRSNPLVLALLDSAALYRGETAKGAVRLKDPDGSAANPPAKLTLVTRPEISKTALTVNLTCSR